MTNILYRCRTGISRRGGCTVHFIILMALVGGLELMTRFYL